MRSIILIGDEGRREKYISDFINFERILPHSVTLFTEELNVKSAREIISNLSFKHSEKKLLIINSVNFVAQNALLKTLEELSENVSIIISAKNLYGILDTVKSRLFIIDVGHTNDEDSLNISTLEPDKKLSEIDKYLSNYSDDESLDRLIILYRNDFLKRLLSLRHDQIKDNLNTLKNLLNVYQLVKNNNLNLRISVETAFLK